MATIERSELRVEGADDAHAIKHLLRQHGCLCPIKGVDHNGEWSENAPKIVPVGDDISLLKGVSPAVSFGTGRSVAFVLDADQEASNRWSDVCNRIADIGLSTPSQIPSDGYVDTSTTYRTRVGVWLMPDNRSPGALEAFLKELVNSNDPLLQVAEQSTRKAKEAGALFPDHKQDKAIVRSWLAWQEEPGLPYGRAVSKHYFLHDTTLAGTFVAWFKRVFECG